MWLPLTLLALICYVPTSWAHGRVTNITHIPSSTTSLNTTTYPGFDPEHPSTPLIAWSASNLGNIFVPPSSFNTSAINCHFHSSPGGLSIPAAPGDAIVLQWNEWPVSHVGPVLTYLAACKGEGGCEDVADVGISGDGLEWVKIDELGWLNSSGWDVLGLGGTWASDVLIAQGFRWRVTIPWVLAQGEYVLRHEIIALHVADQVDGAQAYPQCVNVRVDRDGGGVELGKGVKGEELYGMRDKGILVDVHREIGGYEIPGPGVWGEVTRVGQPDEKR